MDKKLIFEKIPLVMADLEAVGKEKKNVQQGFMYRGIDDVYNALHAVLAKHKVFTVPRVLGKTREERQTKTGGALTFSILEMEFTFFAEDGSSVTAVVIGEGMDSGDKSSNKAMAVAHKYALLQVFAIPTVDMDDPDKETHDVAPRIQQRPQNTVSQQAQARPGNQFPANRAVSQPQNQPTPQPVQTNAPESQINNSDNSTMLYKSEIVKLVEARKSQGWTVDKAADFMKRRFNVVASTNLKPEQFKELTGVIQRMAYGDAYAALARELSAAKADSSDVQ